MSQQNDILDFSGLFKLDVILHIDVTTYSFYEVGLRKFLAFSSDKELQLCYIDSQSDKEQIKTLNYDWDFVDNPIYCMCFEPSGTWLVIVSEDKVLLLPFLPKFIPQQDFDQKWSLMSVTVLPLSTIPRSSSLVWWLTKESENILIIGSKNGTINFYSLEYQTIVGRVKVSCDIINLQICFDDSLDLLALLITGEKSQQWKLILEHRSYGYNWLNQTKAQADKRDSFISYIKQLSKDKITLFSQGGSRDGNKSQTVEYLLKPSEYLPLFRKGSNNWALTAQYVNGRHFITAFELNEGTLILESPEEDAPSRTLRPIIKTDDKYIQGLWSQKIIYLLRKNQLEVHSSNFSVVQGGASIGAKKEFTELWSAELIGDALGAHLFSIKEPSSSNGEWKEPTFISDLQLPLFNLEPCLVVTTTGAYLLNTVKDPCAWLVSLIMRGGAGCEQSAAGLGACVPALLRAAADLLMARGSVPPAEYLYSLSKSPSDGWAARLGVFGRHRELSMFKATDNTSSLGNTAITIKLMAGLLKVAANSEENFDLDVQLHNLTALQLTELCTITAATGLWESVPKFSIHCGRPSILVKALKSKSELCRGALDCLLNNRCLVSILLEENSQWLFDFITKECEKFDTRTLKCLALWLNPLQDQLRPVIRDMKQKINSVYTTRMLSLISTFIQLSCVIESRNPCPEIHTDIKNESESKSKIFSSNRSVSCGLTHWALVDDGCAKIMPINVTVTTEIVGRVISVACGRHHTIILTENGVYAGGDNSYGQLGIGKAWGDTICEQPVRCCSLLHVGHQWTDPPVYVSAGHYHSAVIDEAGRLYTWGWGVHGQLGFGEIDDEWSPRLVTLLQGHKVLQVGCGASHTTCLVSDGTVWCFGAGIFGQLGTGTDKKSSVPIKVALAEPIASITVGYFHNLAMTEQGRLYTWGASHQQIRAAFARRSMDASPSSTPSTPSSPTQPPVACVEPHMSPQLVDCRNVVGKIVQISAGWHHSCLLNNLGTIYSWGLNFDGQLGSGDRKQIVLPTEVAIRSATTPNSIKAPQKICNVSNESYNTKALMACGGDFTLYIDEDGKIYSTGNTHQQVPNEKDKQNNRVIMMKTTKRLIKIPASRSGNNMFMPIDQVDIMFPFEIDDMQRNPLDITPNPLSSMRDFKRNSWPDEIITTLKQWIDVDSIVHNSNMAAKLSFHNKMYSQCLKLLLDNLKLCPKDDKLYLLHTNIDEFETSGEGVKMTPTKDEIRIIISNIVSKRIKEISLTIINELPYPDVDYKIYKTLPCCCDEVKYIPNKLLKKSITNIKENDLSIKAAKVIDKCLSLFPVDAELWEVCFRLSKDFYLDNNLSVIELESVLSKYMESNASTMAAAIMYSNDCKEYGEIFSPKFYLNMSNQVLDTWG